MRLVRRGAEWGWVPGRPETLDWLAASGTAGATAQEAADGPITKPRQLARPLNMFLPDSSRIRVACNFV